MPVWDNEFSSDSQLDSSAVRLSTGEIVARFDSSGRRVANTTAAPTVAAGAGAGTGATATVAGTDEVGTVTVNTAGTPAAGVIATVTFKAGAYAGAPYGFVNAQEDGGAATIPFVTTTTTTLVIHTHTALTTGTTYHFNYHAIGA